MSVLSLIRCAGVAVLIVAAAAAALRAQTTGQTMGQIVDQIESQGAAEGEGSAVENADSAAEPGQGLTGLPLPRFVSLRAPKVNMRTGPGVRYPIDWVYNRAGLPLEVIDEFETWRQVRDWEGSVGWIHQSMLSGERKVMVRDKQRLLRSEPDPAAPGVALLAPGVLADLRRCADAWCQIEVGETSGWLRQIDVFGLYPDETLQ